eukprot:748310-Hanusia_phi.AAC.2
MDQEMSTRWLNARYVYNKRLRGSIPRLRIVDKVVIVTESGRSALKIAQNQFDKLPPGELVRIMTVRATSYCGLTAFTKMNPSKGIKSHCRESPTAICDFWINLILRAFTEADMQKTSAKRRALLTTYLTFREYVAYDSQ